MQLNQLVILPSNVNCFQVYELELKQVTCVPPWTPQSNSTMPSTGMEGHDHFGQTATSAFCEHDFGWGRLVNDPPQMRPWEDG